MTTRVAWKAEKYVVVCLNKKQAKNLFERLVRHFRASNKTFRMKEKEMYISNNIETFMCIPQRKMCDISYGRKGFQCILTSWREIDKWLDNIEKEREK